MTTKKKSTGKAKSGMSDESRAAWRARKSADLGRAAALKKLVATPPAPKAAKAIKAANPKRAHPAPADAATPDTEAPVAEPIASGESAHNPTTGEDVVREDANRKGPQGKKEKQTKEGKRAPKAVKEPKPRADGCLTIAARLLAESKEPLGTKTLIEMMATNGLWTSPGGKTPAATLYAAIVREIATKGKDARFRKADRGLFAANT